MSTQRNVMANMKAFADLKRNGFDLTNGHYYSQKCGEIIPIKAFHTIPGDFLKVNISDKNLSFPMNTAAFLHARKEITTYHVPYNHVFSLFNQLQATRPDPKTSSLVPSDEFEEPRISFLDLYHNVIYQWYLYAIYEYYIPAWLRNYLATGFQNPVELETDVFEGVLDTIRKEYLSQAYYATKFGDISISDTIDVTQKSGLNITLTISITLPAIQYIYTSEFGFTFPTLFDTKNIQAGDETIEDFALDIEGRFRVFSWARKLDMLGFGNLYPLLKIVEQSIADTDDAVLVDDANGRCMEAAMVLLMRNIVNISSSKDAQDAYHLTRTNIYSILAYNKVFYDYFRNTYFDLNYNSRNYNIDFCAIDDVHNSPYLLATDFDVRFLDIEYHQWKKDIVTGVLPEAQYGAVAGLSMSLNLSSLSLSGTGTISTGSPSSLGATGFTPQGGSQTVVSLENGVLKAGSGSALSGVMNVPHNHNFNLSSVAQGLSVSGSSQPVSFDVLSLKRAEMLQDYRQMLMRNGNRTIDIFKGLYGDKPASEDDNSPRFVDAFGSTLFVDTIVSTADTAQQDSNKGALGDLGARSVISTGGNFKFKTSDFGVLLFLGYIVPDAVYPSFGIDPANRALDPESHFIPFFQNLGFQPLHNVDRNIFYAGANTMFNVRGFAPSYVRLKTDVDYAHGNFTKLPVHNIQTRIGLSGSRPKLPTLTDFVGSFNHWVPLRSDAVLSELTTLKHLYISPSYWDNIFIQKANSDFETDHFIVDTHIFISAVRKLSKLGLPNF